MSIPTVSFLDALKADADRVQQAEDGFRREISQRIKALEQDRIFAFRRLNLMRAIAETIAQAEDEDIAVAGSLAVLRAKLGWSTDSDARAEVMSHFVPVAQAVFASVAKPEEGLQETDALAALKDFEAWYAATHPAPFWILFENYMPETPVVDF